MKYHESPKSATTCSLQFAFHYLMSTLPDTGIEMSMPSACPLLPDMLTVSSADGIDAKGTDFMSNGTSDGLIEY